MKTARRIFRSAADQLEAEQVVVEAYGRGPVVYLKERSEAANFLGHGCLQFGD